MNHGTDCKKAWHNSNRGGYLHGDADDTPFTVDGMSYCGRCHYALDADVTFNEVSNSGLLNTIARQWVLSDFEVRKLKLLIRIKVCLIDDQKPCWKRMSEPEGPFGDYRELTRDEYCKECQERELFRDQCRSARARLGSTIRRFRAMSPPIPAELIKRRDSVRAHRRELYENGTPS